MDGRCFHTLRPLLLGLVAAFSVTVCWAQTTACEKLTKLALPQLELTSASEIGPGEFTAPQNPELKTPEPRATIPRFCRVEAIARPSPDSEIHIEVWLPEKMAWNGKLLGVGNGGYTGRISYGALENGITVGYATASSDTGHIGSNLKFGAGHSEKIVDWGYRATHVTAEGAKQILHAYYGEREQHAYFNGCSTGGEQGLQEAQRFPGDYDGIVAGDPGNDRIELNAAFLWSHMASHPHGEAVLNMDTLRLLHRAALAACDTIDGVKDGVIGDPLHCRFDPSVLLCRTAEAADCLSQTQVDAARKIYQGPVNPRTGKKIMAGWEPGSELTGPGDYSGWSDYVLHGDEPARLDFWRYWVFDNPRWDWHTFDFDRDLAYAEKKLQAVNASNPNLQAFKARGGKLIVYHGWVDPVGPPRDSIDYFEKVRSSLGGTEATLSFFRLFLVPGMSHCNGGPGYLLAGGARGVDDAADVPRWSPPDADHDVLSALDRWVQEGVAPEQILAFHSVPGGRSEIMPVCAYPKAAMPSGIRDDGVREFNCTAQ